MVLARECLDWSASEVVRSEAYETCCWTTRSVSKVICAKGLEYNAESGQFDAHFLKLL